MTSIEQRKLVKLGKSTLVISLPAGWIKRKGLKAGDTLTLYIGENEIVIAPSNELSASKLVVVLKVKNVENNIVYRSIVSAYVNGATEITVELSDPSLLKEALKQAKEASSRLIGIEIVDQSTDKIVLQTFTDIRSHDVPSLINRSLKFLISMIEHLSESNIDMKFLEDIENEIDKLSRLGLRMLITNPDISKYQSLHLSKLFTNLENASDSVLPLARSIEGKARPIADVLNTVIEVLEFVKGMKLGQTELREINDRIELIEDMENSVLEREVDETLKYRVVHVLDHIKNLLLALYDANASLLIYSDRELVL